MINFPLCNWLPVALQMCLVSSLPPHLAGPMRNLALQAVSGGADASPAPGTASPEFSQGSRMRTALRGSSGSSSSDSYGIAAQDHHAAGQAVQPMMPVIGDRATAEMDLEMDHTSDSLHITEGAPPLPPKKKVRAGLLQGGPNLSRTLQRG